MKLKLTPDMLALAVFAAALLLEWLFPLSVLPNLSFTSLHVWLGAGVAVAGFAIEAAAGAALSRAGTATRPHQQPTTLVDTGPFALSRNPLYCGMLVLLVGLSIALSVEWGVILAPLLWLALDRLVVPGEEAALAAAFPREWLSYKAKTPRWIVR